VVFVVFAAAVVFVVAAVVLVVLAAVVAAADVFAAVLAVVPAEVLPHAVSVDTTSTVNRTIADNFFIALLIVLLLFRFADFDFEGNYEIIYIRSLFVLLNQL